MRLSLKSWARSEQAGCRRQRDSRTAVRAIWVHLKERACVLIPTSKDSFNSHSFIALILLFVAGCAGRVSSVEHEGQEDAKHSTEVPTTLAEYVTCLDVAVIEAESIRWWSTKGSPIILDYFGLKMVNQGPNFIVCEGTAIYDNGLRRQELLFGRKIDCADLEALPTQQWQKRVRVGTANIGGVCISTSSQTSPSL